mgnify:CR=1 FL=1
MGFCTDEQAEGFLNVVPWVERAIVAVGRHPAQVLARGQPRRADATPEISLRGWAQDLEAVADGPEVVQPLVRLLAGA